MSVYNFLVLAIVVCYETNAEPVDNKPAENYTTAKNNHFVEVIRKDLTRNNDDYKEIVQENKIINNDRIGINTNKIHESKSRVEAAPIKNNGNRRKNVKSYEEYDYDETTKTSTEPRFIFKTNTNRSQVVFVKNRPQKININRNQSRLDNGNKMMLPTINTFSFTPSMKNLRLNKKQNVIPKFVKKEKIDKFKQFMKKNEALLKDFISSKLEMQTQQTGLRQFSTTEDSLKFLKPVVREERMKKIQTSEHKNDGKLPSPELLDMAPAKGGRIHRQREKGRLCQRHVLRPEGPKYDSRGRWYVPAHALVASRAYAETKRPKLLLPRCCNCCKKSVLGCE